MGYNYDLLLKNAVLVDPVNGQNGPADLGVKEGKVSEIGPGLDPSKAENSYDLSGKHLVPGIIDLHVHAASWLRGSYAHKMMALAGVVTALDMSGPIDSCLDMAQQFGAGLNLACLHYVRPGHTVKDTDPGQDELNSLMAQILEQGAFGFKILGGHYPITPMAIDLAVQAAYDARAYVAIHAGSLQNKSDIKGFHEAVDLVGDRPVHMAHINSYCRGKVRDCLQETEEALGSLMSHPNICSEAYLSPMNGTSGRCVDGVPESKVTIMCLETGGYEGTEAGLEKAILEGWAQVNQPSGGQVILATGPDAVAFWKEEGTNSGLSFAVNPEIPRLRLLTARRPDGAFVVDCLSTDGGGIPRNVIVPMGLAMVALKALSLEDFVRKTSRNPAAILGLTSKGHLGLGMDADISVLDLTTHSPYMSVSNGKVVMYRGHVCGSGTRVITTKAGEAAVKARGMEVLAVDTDKTPLLQRADK